MKILACTVLVATLAASGAAQVAYVPDAMPSVGGNGNEPMNSSATTGRYQQILDAQYLPNQPVRFTAVAFANALISPTTFQVSSDFQMRMSHTTASCPSANLDSNIAPVPTELVKVTNGFTYTSPRLSGWADFKTVQDFGYDGSSNLILEIRFRGQNTNLGFACRSIGGITRAYANSTTTDNFNATTGTVACSNGLKTRLVYVTKDILFTQDTVQVGGTLGIGAAGLTPGHTYQIAASLGNRALRLTSSYTVYLSLDNLFGASITVGAPVFNNYVGAVTASGRVGASLRVPSFPGLVGLAVYHAAVTIGVSRISGATNTAGTMVIP